MGTTKSSTASSAERIPLLQRPVDFALTRRTQLACAAVLVAEGLERLCYYSLQGNLVFFLSKAPLCWPISLAVYAQLVLSGVMYVMGLFGGLLSDSYLSRYTVIVLGYVFYLLGYVYLPILGHFASVDTSSNASIISQFDYHEGTNCNNDGRIMNLFVLCNDTLSWTNGIACSTSTFVALTLIAVGSGIVRTNLAPFGGFQVGVTTTPHLV